MSPRLPGAANPSRIARKDQLDNAYSLIGPAKAAIGRNLPPVGTMTKHSTVTCAPLLEMIASPACSLDYAMRKKEGTMPLSLDPAIGDGLERGIQPFQKLVYRFLKIGARRWSARKRRPRLA